MNRVDLTGRPTKDPEIRYSQGTNPMAIAKFTLAVDRDYKKEGEQSADFINIVAFGKTAEFCEKFVQKGVKYGVCGKIQTGSYDDKDGKKVYTTEVVAEKIEFEEKKSAETQQETGGFMNIPAGLEDELPFNRPER